MTSLPKLDEITRNPFYPSDSINTQHKQYCEFRQAIYDTARDLRDSHFPTTSAMVLETIHAMWILSVILRFSYADGPHSISSLVLAMDFAAISLYFETTNMTVDELCDDVYRANLPGYLEQNRGYWEQTQIRNTYLALNLYRQSILDPADNGSGITVTRIIRLLHEIVGVTCKIGREEASKRCLCTAIASPIPN